MDLDRLYQNLAKCEKITRSESLEIMMKFLIIFSLLSAIAFAQEVSNPLLLKGKWDVEIWTGGGAGVNGSTASTGLLTAGFRFGKVLTPQLGSGSFRGNLEADVEVIPAFIVFEDQPVFGASFTPVLLKWNFTSHQKIVPFFEAGAGVLVSNSDVPEGTTNVNFTPQGGLGIHFLKGGKWATTVTLRYMHISNGGRAKPNPGINSIQLLAGFNWIL